MKPSLLRTLGTFGVVVLLSTQVRAESPLIVALGADNVAGHGNGHRSGGVMPDQAFPAQLETLLHTHGIDAHVVNAGVAGDTCPDILARTDSDVPDGTRLVIFDRPNGNDKKADLIDRQPGCIEAIKDKLAARHIAIFVLPAWNDIPGTVDYRDPDGHHFTAQGHAVIAAFLVPHVIELLSGQSH